MAGITAIVGSGTSAKIWPQRIPEGQSPPCIVFVRVDGAPYIYLAGTTGARRTVLHVYCYGTTQSQADTLANLVKTNTETMRGTYAGVYVNRAQTLGIFDDAEYMQPGSDEKRYSVRLVIALIHGE